ncbi:MAG: hypothetical protein AB7H80_12440 [Candidatus Kapaibacterium sp.]
MSNLEKISIWILVGILVLLSSAYVYGVGSQLQEMIARPVRISYFLTDLAILYPLAIATIVGMFKRKEWGRRFFLLTIGALLFDMAHQVCYLIWENYSGLSLFIPVILLTLIIGYAGFTYYALYLHQRKILNDPEHV